jgi:sodium/hydrogen antiporter
VAGVPGSAVRAWPRRRVRRRRGRRLDHGLGRQRFRIRREYQSLYGIGLVLAAYVAGEAVGGDGFLAAFAAGLAVTALNQTLCDCFLDFGQVIAEMTMLLAFVLFGALLSTMVGDVPLLPALALALLGIFVIRPVVVGSVLRVGRAGLSRYASSVPAG